MTHPDSKGKNKKYPNLIVLYRGNFYYHRTINFAYLLTSTHSFYFKLLYPISTLPEHLHSTSLSYAETTLNSRKPISFPLIAHYLFDQSPSNPHPPSLGDPDTPSYIRHSHFQRPASHTCFWPLSLVMFASPLRL